MRSTRPLLALGLAALALLASGCVQQSPPPLPPTPAAPSPEQTGTPAPTPAAAPGFPKHPANPIFSSANLSAFDAREVEEPVVHKIGGLYHMWFEYDVEKLGLWNRIGYATSADGIHWTPFSRNPVLSVGPPGAWASPPSRSAASLGRGPTPEWR